MKRTVIIVAAIAIVGLIVSLHGSAALFDPVVFSPMIENSTGFEWQPVVHESHNAYHMWRLDPLLAAQWAGGEPLVQRSWYGIVCALVFYFGCVFAFSILSAGRGVLMAAVDALMVLTIVLFCFGNDVVLLGTLVWLPYLIGTFALIFADRAKAPLYAFLAVFFSFRSAHAANQLAPLVIGVAYAVAAAHAAHTATGMVKSLTARIILPACLIFPLLVTVTSPLPPLADYPSYARVVEYDQPTGLVRPLVGQHLPLPVVDREFLRQVYLGAGLLLLAGVVGALVVYRRMIDPLLGLVAALCVAVLFDSAMVSEFSSQIAPLASLARLVPGLAPLPLLPVFTAFTIIVFYCWGVARGAHVLLLAMLVGFVVVPFNSSYDSQYAFLRAGSLQKPISFRVGSDFDARFGGNYNLTDEGRRYAEIATSPSFALLERFGFRLIDEGIGFQNERFTSIADLKPRLVTSTGNPTRKGRRMIDQRESNRWSVHRGKQLGDEWVHIAFPKPVALNGLELDPGQFAADFPRGVRVSFRERCDPSAGVGNRDDYLWVLEEPDWKGPLLFTTDGFPYFGKPHDVRLFFRSTVVAQCLLIEQIGTDAHHDWSVSELRALLPVG